jgi:protocatechuate 3,4-dioxygenase beta subunit
MKNLILTLALVVCAATFAQEPSKNQRKRSVVYDFKSKAVSDTDTIPGFQTQKEKLKITGIIYESDGKTPAKNVILYIYQADEEGEYHAQKVDGKRVLRHEGWARTDENGRYTFYTFVPGTYWSGKSMKQIHGMIQEPSTDKTYSINQFVFDNDPMLSKSCRKKIAKYGLNNILKLERDDHGMLIGTRDIILSDEIRHL